MNHLQLLGIDGCIYRFYVSCCWACSQEQPVSQPVFPRLVIILKCRAKYHFRRCSPRLNSEITSSLFCAGILFKICLVSFVIKAEWFCRQTDKCASVGGQSINRPSSSRQQVVTNHNLPKARWNCQLSNVQFLDSIKSNTFHLCSHWYSTGLTPAHAPMDPASCLTR